MSSETTPDETTTTTTTTMEDPSAIATPQQQQPSTPSTLSEKLEKMKISSTSFSIWPPTQRTRDAVTNRLIDTLSTPSVLSKRYGTVSTEDAAAIARSIEEEAFSFASAAAAAAENGADESIDGGIEILQVYSKEISKRVLDAVKSKSSAATPAVDGGDAAAGMEVGSGEGEVKDEGEKVKSEAVSSADNESSSV